MSSTTPIMEASEVIARLDAGGQDVVSPAGGVIYITARRFWDIALSLVLICLMSPIMIIVAILIKITSPGPVIFIQERAGLNGKPFKMFKFRTMYRDAEDDREYLSNLNIQNGPVFKVRSDPRITLIGAFLRKTSIDELPQLFNVIAGQMSLVGPRPLWLPEAQSTTGSARLRVIVPPGMTGLWQISGRSELQYEQWILLDLYYITHRSFLIDLLIILRTIPAVISGRGAY